MLVWVMMFGLTPNVFAQNVTDKLVVALADKHLPKMLLQEKNKSWKMGTYDLTVNKTAGVTFNSTEQYLSLSVPIEVLMVGQVNQTFLGQKIILNCTSTVLTEAKLQVTPVINPPNSTASVEVLVPIPESNLHCDGLTLAIKPILEQLVATKKQQWQTSLEQDIQGLFKQVGM
jgi:hypothetical protein